MIQLYRRHSPCSYQVYMLYFSSVTVQMGVRAEERFDPYSSPAVVSK